MGVHKVIQHLASNPIIQSKQCFHFRKCTFSPGLEKGRPPVRATYIELLGSGIRINLTLGLGVIGSSLGFLRCVGRFRLNRGFS